MASVRIEQKAFTDGRFKILAAKMGTTRFDALARMAFLWEHCTEEKTYFLTAEMIDAVTEFPGFHEIILQPEISLAERSERGIRIKGTKGRIEWLAKARKNGRKGGRPKKPKPNQTVTHSLTGIEPESNLLALTLAPALALKKEDISAAVEEWDRTLKHFGKDRKAEQDQVALGQLLARHGLSDTLQALIGFRLEERTQTYNPAQHVSLGRLRKPTSFDHLKMLGAQFKPTGPRKYADEDQSS